MFIAKVIGVVVSSCKEENLISQKLLMVQDIKDIGTKKSLIAVDGVGAGIGEIVLVVYEGGAARHVINSKDAPINLAVIGIVDYPGEFVGNTYLK